MYAGDSSSVRLLRFDRLICVNLLMEFQVFLGKFGRCWIYWRRCRSGVDQGVEMLQFLDESKRVTRASER